MDLFADDMKAEAQRLIALGATPKPWTYPPDADYIVLEDPDGNPFCVVQDAVPAEAPGDRAPEGAEGGAR